MGRDGLCQCALCEHWKGDPKAAVRHSAVLLCLNLETELPWQGGRTCEMEIEGNFGLKQGDGQ